MTIDILGITDIVTLTVICGVIAGLIILVFYLVRKNRKAKDSGIGESQDEVFRMVSRIKYPAKDDTGSLKEDTRHSRKNPEDDPLPPKTELARDHKDITASLRTLAKKYSLTEIILATDDGLVFATSADRDVQIDAVKYSQIAKNQAVPDEPGVSLFEVEHRDSRLVGIIRAKRDLPGSWKHQIRDDTKVILQWWL